MHRVRSGPGAIVIATFCSMALIGCAKVVVRPVTPSDTDGLRFYRPILYLHFFNDKEGVCSARVVPLPDFSQEWLIETKTGIGAVEANATLSDGWNVTALGAKADSKVAETITALAAVAAAAKPAPAAVPATSGCANPPPGLYAIIKSAEAPGHIQLKPVDFGQNISPSPDSKP